MLSIPENSTRLQLKKGPDAKYGRANFTNIKKDIRRKRRRNFRNKIRFRYTYGQIKLDENTKNLCIFTVTGWDDFTGYCRFLKGFYGLADIPTIFQERIDTTLEHKHPAWLYDIIIVTKGSIDEHETEDRETMKKLEQAGYRLNSKKKSNGSNTKLTNKENDHYKIN